MRLVPRHVLLPSPFLGKMNLLSVKRSLSKVFFFLLESCSESVKGGREIPTFVQFFFPPRMFHWASFMHLPFRASCNFFLADVRAIFPSHPTPLAISPFSKEII